MRSGNDTQKEGRRCKGPMWASAPTGRMEIAGGHTGPPLRVRRKIGGYAGGAGRRGKRRSAAGGGCSEAFSRKRHVFRRLKRRKTFRRDVGKQRSLPADSICRERRPRRSAFFTRPTGAYGNRGRPHRAAPTGTEENRRVRAKIAGRPYGYVWKSRIAAL